MVWLLESFSFILHLASILFFTVYLCHLHSLLRSRHTCTGVFPPDECQLTTPCLNGGDCLFNPADGTITCECDPPYTGERCGVTLSTCTSATLHTDNAVLLHCFSFRVVLPTCFARSFICFEFGIVKLFLCRSKTLRCGLTFWSDLSRLSCNSTNRICQSRTTTVRIFPQRQTRPVGRLVLLTSPPAPPPPLRPVTSRRSRCAVMTRERMTAAPPSSSSVYSCRSPSYSCSSSSSSSSYELAGALSFKFNA